MLINWRRDSPPNLCVVGNSKVSLIDIKLYLLRLIEYTGTL